MPHEQRKLAAIMCADVVGYSRLIGLDETGTLARLRALRAEVIDPTIAEHGGRLVKTTGDGLLVEFGSVVHATRCAVAMQKQIAQRDAGAHSDRRIALRIGIHVGDIVLDGDDILGDGVNVAARLEGQAEPGGICVSGRVQEDLAGKLELNLQDCGDQTLKNIARPVRVWRWSPAAPSTLVRAPVALSEKPSIAVMPFSNQSGDAEQAYFCDGITEDIITALSRFSSLFVIARSSSFALRSQAADVHRVGRDLGVRYVLQGSVRKAANRVRITAHLVDVETGIDLWAERYDGELNDIFALQDDISRRIVGTITPEIRLAEQTRAGRIPPETLRAYDLAMRSAYLCRQGLDRYDRDLILQARELAAQAVATDPASVAAYYAVAESDSVLAEMANFDGDMEAHLANAAAAGETLLTLDPMNDAGYYQIGHTAIRRRRPADALTNLRRAHELNSNDSRTLRLLAWAEINLGLADAAKEHAEQALRLSPRDPQRYFAYWILAVAAFIADKPEEGATWARRAIEENPKFYGGYGILAACLIESGQRDAARAAVEFLEGRHPDYIRSRMAGNTYFGVPALVERYTRALKAAAGGNAPPAGT